MAMTEWLVSQLHFSRDSRWSKKKSRTYRFCNLRCFLNPKL